MFRPDTDNWACLFVCVSIWRFFFAFWPYTVVATVLYAIDQGFTTTPHSNRKAGEDADSAGADPVTLVPHGLPDIDSGGSWGSG
jgi:hypothetical protein